jgi:DNA-binding IclR family transcriptional regulator
MSKNTGTEKGEAAPGTADEFGVAAVNRALSLLAAFSKQHRTFTLAQLAEHTGLYKSTILRLAESLEAFGYLHRSADGVFALGPTPMRLAALYQSGLHPAEIVMPVLRELMRTTTESAALYVRTGDKRLCAYRVTSPRAISDNVQQGELLPLDKGAGGRVLLAFDGAAGAAYDEVRRTMFSMTRGDRDQETAAVACPVFGAGQRLEGALSISGPIQRFTPAAVRKMRPELFAAARTLTTGLGGDADVYAQAETPKGF